MPATSLDGCELGTILGESYSAMLKLDFVTLHPPEPLVILGSRRRGLTPYSIARRPVSNRQYALFVKATRAAIPESMKIPGFGDRPVWGLSLKEARAFALWASDEMGKDLRLPHEEEWTFASRTGLIEVNEEFDEWMDTSYRVDEMLITLAEAFVRDTGFRLAHDSIQ